MWLTYIIKKKYSRDARRAVDKNVAFEDFLFNQREELIKKLSNIFRLCIKEGIHNMPDLAIGIRDLIHPRGGSNN